MVQSSHSATGNSGIGYETSLHLALHNARVYIGGRSKERVDKAINEMKRASPNNKLDLRFFQLDLQNLRSVREAAKWFGQQESRLDLLINNAGVLLPLSTRSYLHRKTDPISDHGYSFRGDPGRLRGAVAGQLFVALSTDLLLDSIIAIDSITTWKQRSRTGYQPFNGDDVSYWAEEDATAGYELGRP